MSVFKAVGLAARYTDAGVEYLYAMTVFDKLALRQAYRDYRLADDSVIRSFIDLADCSKCKSLCNCVSNYKTWAHFL